MKHIFLLGDSIRQGYDKYLREKLEGDAEVYWAEDNGRFVQYTLRYLHEWAESVCMPAKIDLVLWNNGLWDVLHVLGNDPQTPLCEYENGLRRIISRIHQVFPNAEIRFVLTTAVIEEYMNPPGLRSNEEIREYNRAASEIMKAANIRTIDLFEASCRLPPECRTPEGTHFTEEGYSCLAEYIWESLKKDPEIRVRHQE